MTTTLPGLECLESLDQLVVKQQIERIEVATGWETNNKYVVLDNAGQKLFYAVEDSSTLTRMSYGGRLRPFELNILNSTDKQQVLRITRPYRCDNCCCPGNLQEISVHHSGTNQLLGKVTQEWSLLCSKFSIKNSANETALYLKSQLMGLKFDVLALDGTTNIGTINKNWAGWTKEAITDADNFVINFPADLDVNLKVVLLVAVFLVDFLYNEK